MIMIQKARGDEEMISLGLVLFFPLILSWISFIILHNLQKCQKCCCTCCQFDQVYQKTFLDPNNPDELVYVSKTPEQAGIEMVVQVLPMDEHLKPSNLDDTRTLPKILQVDQFL